MADCLESWKEIASYFNRGVRTVRRWEKEEGLPVHRQVHKTLGTVYAYRSELDAWRRRRSVAASSKAVAHPESTSARVMLAVLPFENLSSDPEQDYVADGLTEEMISQLGRYQPDTLGVIARTTMMQYRARQKTVRQIGGELHVDYVVDGSVRREAERLRVTAHLIRASDQSHLWSGTYEQAIRSILVLQRDLAADIAREIRLKVSAKRPSPRGDSSLVNPTAYHAHLKGRHLLNRFTPESVRRSLDYFRQAIETDPTYAASYASLAEAYERLPIWVDEPPETTVPLALAAAEHARQLDPNLPEAYASLGMISANYHWDWTGAERHFQRALELNPSCSPARHWYAEFLAEMGRFDDALETIERAQIHDPLSSSIQATRAFVLLMGHRFEDAVSQAQLVLEMDPHYPMALIRLGIAYDGLGRPDEAVLAFQRASHAAPELLDCGSLLGYAQARAGNANEALKQFEILERLAETRYVPAFLLANVLTGLGRHDEAIALIEKEYDVRGWYLLLVKHSPHLDPLRSHPRFQKLLKRMNFPA